MRVRKKYLETVGLFNHFIQAGLFSSIFVFTSNIRGIRIILERSLHAVLFPIAIAPDAIASLLTLFNFVKAKNKNLGKTFELIYIPTKAAIVFTAVFAGLSVTAVNSLFLTAVSSGILYHGSLALYNAYQLWKTPKNSASYLKLRNLYKNNLITNGISTLVGLIVLTGILTTLVFSSFLSAPILAVAGIGTAVMLMLATTYSVYRYFKTSELDTNAKFKATESVQEDDIKLTAPEANTDIKPTAPPLIEHESQISPSKGYYYRVFRSTKLKGNLDHDINFLLTEVHNKKQELLTQMERSQAGLWPETTKRQTKVDFLEAVNVELVAISLLKDSLKADSAFKTLDSILSTAHGDVFQSFFRAKGDMGDLVDAIKAFINCHKIKLEEAPQPSTSKLSPV